MARWKGAALLAAVALAGSAAAGGTQAVPETAAVAGKTLRLNGTAMMTMWWFQLYSVSLYLESPVAGAAEAISSEQAKEVRLVLHRHASHSQIGAALQDGMRRAGANLAALKPRLDRLLAAIPDVKAGDLLRIDYLPGGRTLFTDGKTGRSMTIEGKDFADALFGIWLGPGPETARIRNGLMGGPSYPRAQARTASPSRP
jgi:hypothetical protein